MAIADDGMTTSVLRGGVFVNAEDITIECNVEWHPQGGNVEWHPQGVSHVEGSHDPNAMLSGTHNEAMLSGTHKR